MPEPNKDRSLTIPLVPGRAEILYLRSSQHPLRYALILKVREENGDWQTVLSVDNSHDERAHVDTHHVHRYAEGIKQHPESLPFGVSGTNDAMVKVIDWMADKWEELAA